MLDDPEPFYETISYVWGDKTERGTIYLLAHSEDEPSLGHARDVPASSETVLRRMRHSDQTRTVWIDSICVRQDRLDERSQQVSFMHEIYESGTRNLIWLGEDDGYTEKALDDVRRLVEDMRISTNDFEDIETTLYHENSIGKLSITAPRVEIHDWTTLSQFYSSPWFSRLWGQFLPVMISKTLRYL